jgi:uncharacterized protein (TIGR02611 family)
VAAEETGDGRKRTIDRIRERKERHKQRNKLYRFVFAVVGILLLIVGVFLTLPGVPGPGLVIVAIGLGMLALEFDRAERLLEKILDRLERASDKAKPWQKVVLGTVTVVAVVASVAALFFWDVPVIPG